MESNEINILWIDDEYDIWDSLPRRAKKDYNIKLHPYKSKEEGLEAIRKNPDYYYSGILLDGCILEAKDSLPGTQSIEYSGELINEVKKINKGLKICVLTGNPNGTINQPYKKFVTSTQGVQFYEKSRDAIKVLQILKDAAINKDEYRFEVDFPNIYKLYKVGSIKKSSIDRLVKFNGLIKKSKSIEFQAVDARMVIEDFLGYLCEKEFFPSHIRKGVDSWVAESTYYLRVNSISNGKNEISKPIIGSLLSTLRLYLNDGTHDDRGSKLGVDEHLKNNKNDLFQMSLIYMLFDVLDFYGSNIEEIIKYERKDVEPERKDVEPEVCEKECKVIRISENYWATCTPINNPNLEITVPNFKIELAEKAGLLKGKLNVGQTLLLQIKWNDERQRFNTEEILEIIK